jgi:hypothetical protein
MQKNFCLIASVTLVIAFVLSSCSDKQKIIPYTGFNYFQSEVGSWVIYDVDSIVYDGFTNKVDTFRYQIKELVESEITDNAGRTALRIERFFRGNDTTDWQIAQVWSAVLTESSGERVEDNIRYMRLIFPVRRGRNWNGNAFNTLGEQLYRYVETHQPEQINGLSFDSTLTVLQRDDFNLIETHKASEKYAAGMGMIYREWIDLKTEVNGSIKEGLKLYYHISDFGKI